MKKNFINKRKKNILNINLNLFIIIIIIFFFILFTFLNFKNLLNYSYDFVQKFSDKYNYNLLEINFLDLDYISESEILQHFDQFIEKSIFLIPIRKIVTDIKKNKWVETLNITSDYKNSLTINIREEIPLGIYDNDNQKILFSHNLIVLEILKDNNKYSDLIIFYGKNSIINSKELITNLELEFIDFVDSAIFVENRRWNLKLNNMILLKLPENNIKDAIANYKKIYVNFSNKDLKYIESVDLRISNQAIIRYKIIE